MYLSDLFLLMQHKL